MADIVRPPTLLATDGNVAPARIVEHVDEVGADPACETRREASGADALRVGVAEQHQSVEHRLPLLAVDVTLMAFGVQLNLASGCSQTSMGDPDIQMRGLRSWRA
jgi:hypothetical protein